ncbi:D-glycerate dehydrogenase [Oceanobacillus piezotolerans]|uniref:Glyoxylate/hydroxypyruvate reductase B n=1 Tax=Oceanobacillus piezotolerans TaxID=2448030 RepID=A0A498D908_9BACI|nr:D-glycerate dehydrogenase [Oceanobacillus piezotolerans]RLL47773.1 D-glycerate dehydrogenase [Oceanobacillus piezotolerans]
MYLNILVYGRLEKPVLEDLKSRHHVKFFKDNSENTPEFRDFLSIADGIIGLSLQVNSELLDQAPNLKIVSNVSVGYNNLDVKALSERNVMATNTPGILTDTVADMAMGLILSTARRMPELDQYVKSGQWLDNLTEEHYGVDVHHKKLGIIGMGRIGQAIAKRAHFGFDMEILYHNRTRKEDAEKEYDAAYLALDELLQEADFICLITPLTKETEGMIGKREFQLMKKSAIFINVSRGKTIVETELIEALKAGEILAAGLDVFEKEPLELDNELLTLKNVVTLPHIGSSTYETELQMSKLAAVNLEAGLNGEKPPNLINAEVWN